MKLHSQCTRQRSSSHWLAYALVTTATLSAALLSGCTGNAGSSVTTIPASVKKTTVPVLVTDAPSSQLLSFELTINNITLTDTAGQTASVLSNPARIEATHLNGVSEPLVTMALPQDTYTSAVISYSNPELDYLDSTNKVVEYSSMNSGSVTVNLTTPITVSTSSTSLSIDLLLAQSVTISGSTVTINPAFNVTALPVAASPTNDHNGKLEGVQGSISSLTSNGLTLQSPDGSSYVVAVNSSTQYDGISGFSALATGMLVEVDVTTQTDGSLLATSIHVEDDSKHDELEGPVTQVTGSPATSLQLVLQQELGSDLTTTNLGTVYTIAVDSNTTYKVSNRFGDNQNYPFNAVFNGSTIFAGQNVSVVAPTVSGTTTTATRVSLKQQPVAGTIAAITPSGSYTVYTITLDPSDFLVSLTHLATVNVYTNSNTQSVAASPLTVGSKARFEGLLFNTGGTLSMMSGQMGEGEHQSGSDN
ncbi:MAG: DUF5666 domain-containing protein [Acidobacteriaceae bacterium]